jgi:hypothetical protein
MRAITRKVWCHLSLNDKAEGRRYVKDVRSSDALDVDTFSDLVKHVAYISYHNPEFSLFFRAQDEDYRTSDGSSTSLYPFIYRALPRTARVNVLSERFNVLERAGEQLVREFEKQRFLGRMKIEKFREVRWALLQHYGVCKTPLLDVTHSLRVACSFAMDAGHDQAYIFVLGFPHVSGSISYSVEEELLNVKLLSICPPRAIRPYFQEGFLVGSFPSSDVSRSEELDVARRLIAKFRLNTRTFADSNFDPIPHETLYPSNDQMKRVCDSIRATLI